MFRKCASWPHFAGSYGQVDELAILTLSAATLAVCTSLHPDTQLTCGLLRHANIVDTWMLLGQADIGALFSKEPFGELAYLH